MTTIERLARAAWQDELPPDEPRWEDLNDATRLTYIAEIRAALTELRKPDVIEALCRLAADPATGFIAWGGISVHRAADVMDEILGAALSEQPKVAVIPHEGTVR